MGDPVGGQRLHDAVMEYVIADIPSVLCDAEIWLIPRSFFLTYGKHSYVVIAYMKIIFSSNLPVAVM